MDTRTTVFLTLMIGFGLAALAAFIVFLSVRLRHRAANASSPQSGADTTPPAERTPPATRLLGLLLLGVAILLLNWLYVGRAAQYALMAQLLYPASFAVALVLLFDKATRAFSPGAPGETLREWLLCDSIVFLLVLGYVNLLSLGSPEEYRLLWDLLYIALFFLVFWALDRTMWRGRFLLAYTYLVLVPVMLLLWRSAQAVPVAETTPWWHSIWPFFTLSAVFLVFEIIALVARADERSPYLQAFKDAAFVVLYAVFLLIALP